MLSSHAAHTQDHEPGAVQTLWLTVRANTQGMNITTTETGLPFGAKSNMEIPRPIPISILGWR